MEILQQQSAPILCTNKLFISSSTPEFQENCIKTDFCSSRTSRKQNILLSLGHTKTKIVNQHLSEVTMHVLFHINVPLINHRGLTVNGTKSKLNY